MTRNRASRILPFAGACVLAAMTAQANVVDYSATGVIETVDNSSALLPHSLLGAAVGKSFTFNFAVDTATPGSSVALGDETYLSAVQSASYKFGGTTSAFDISSDSCATRFFRSCTTKVDIRLNDSNWRATISALAHLIPRKMDTAEGQR